MKLTSSLKYVWHNIMLSIILITLDFQVVTVINFLSHYFEVLGTWHGTHIMKLTLPWPLWWFDKSSTWNNWTIYSLTHAIFSLTVIFLITLVFDIGLSGFHHVVFATSKSVYICIITKIDQDRLMRTWILCWFEDVNRF